jgi:hypothetical protein
VEVSTCLNFPVRVLIVCEFSGIVRDAFAALGYDAWSCDLIETERPGQHLVADVLEVLADGWDLMVAHPPCTYLARSGARWWNEPGRDELARAAAAFVLALYDAPIPRVAIENPTGQLNRRWRRPDQVIEPYYFGDPYTKRTCLWLKGLPPLMASVVQAGATPWIQANYVTRVSRVRRPMGVARHAKDRSRTMPGIAAAMADQWGAARGW